MSIRLRLLAIIGMSLTMLWSLVAIWMFLDVRNELRTALDDRLVASARMVAGLVSQLPPVGGKGDSPLNVIARDGLACEVSLLRGEVMAQTIITRTAGSPGLADAAPGYGTHVFGGKQWRTYVLKQGDIRIATADRIDVRETLLRDIALAAGVPFAVALIGSLLLLWFGIGRGLAPLERMRATLARRRPDDDVPLPASDAPSELRPLVHTIHHLLERVQGTIARERRFTDDAAHELRTPLTAIKTHLQVARIASTRPQAAEVMAQALGGADQGVLRLQSTLDQLLLLARLDGPVEQASAECTEAGAAARQAIEDAQSDHGGAVGRLVFEAEDVPIPLAIPAALLVSALRNLLDNALRYSPATVPVVLRIERIDAGRVCFSVLDEGPGLTEAECAQAVQRFWRRSNGAQGCGLGLSIVNAIAKRHGGELLLRNRAQHGFEARLGMPVHAAR
ncbi:MAG TPA: ATP-binding protein [Undibacterium sp.]|jgi:two-component system sensor histidine kinase QseC|nr:ATP-binding protein [Undibacterium sp.]